MGVIERWQVRVCNNCQTPDMAACPADRDGIHIYAAPKYMEVVPADQLTGAVEAIRKAPHASHCDAGSPMWPGPCTCWKREWLRHRTRAGAT
jgi:hypothetical protein